MTTQPIVDSWVRLLDTAVNPIDAETQYGPTQGVGIVIEDNYGQLYIRWNTLPLGSNAAHSGRDASEVHVLTERECHQHQNWLEDIDTDEIRHTYGDITIPESRVHATGEAGDFAYYTQTTELKRIDGHYHLYTKEYGVSSFADVLHVWDVYTGRSGTSSNMGVELYRADDTSIWSRPVIAP